MSEIKEKRNTKIIIIGLMVFSFFICYALNTIVAGKLKKLKERIHQLENQQATWLKNSQETDENQSDKMRLFIKKVRINQSQFLDRVKIIFLKTPKNLKWIRITQQKENSVLTGYANSFNEIAFFLQEFKAELIYLKNEKGFMEFQIQLTGKKE